MSSPETIRIGYYNALALRKKDAAETQKRVDYVEAVQHTYHPDVFFITECQETLARRIKVPLGGFVDFKPAIQEHGFDEEEGIAVVSTYDQEKVEIRRQLSWRGKEIWNSRRRDGRELVEVDIRTENGDLTALANHWFHPHHPQHFKTFNMMRPKQSLLLRDRLRAINHDYAWLADTNTLFSWNVMRALYPINPALLNHTGEGNQATWSPYGPVTKKLDDLTGCRLPPILYLDRAAVNPELADFSELVTLPSEVAGVVNPSDHRAILLTITR